VRIDEEIGFLGLGLGCTRIWWWVGFGM